MNDQEKIILLEGDSLLVLPTLEENSMDAVVTDPPYEYGFMGKIWDRSGIAYNVDLWREVWRVMKPGAHLLAFGGTRTYHRMACAIEDAGFEIRDEISYFIESGTALQSFFDSLNEAQKDAFLKLASENYLGMMNWVYGSGFPKSLDIGKAIDKMHGARREVIGRKDVGPDFRGGNFSNDDGARMLAEITAPATDEAKQWDGFGTALKPAHEPICLARKPLEKGLTVAQNVLKWGTGAINIDRCRVACRGETDPRTFGGSWKTDKAAKKVYECGYEGSEQTVSSVGRFPANVIHDGSDEVLEHFPDTKAGGNLTGNEPSSKSRQGEIYGKIENRFSWEAYNDGGSAARFFYCAKASKAERNAGLEGVENDHPTVKPLALMQYLCRLITPPGGRVLDPFCGSGTTGKAALIEKFSFTGIDLDARHIALAKGRLRLTQSNLF